MLLDRIGLSKPEHSHKLRILASSASLPMAESQRATSIRYLWDMFGRNGLRTPEPSMDDWGDAVLTGTVLPVDGALVTLDSEEIAKLVDACADPDQPVRFADPRSVPDGWRQLATALKIDEIPVELGELVRTVIKRSSSLLEISCSDEGDKPRATSIVEIARRLFGTEDASALRAITKLRSASDFLQAWFPLEDEENRKLRISTFRVHNFLRSVEGLFTAPIPVQRISQESERRAAYFGDLSVERGVRFGARKVDDLYSRFVELLYCECCGELYFGGLRSGSASDGAELLPSDPDPESLPERARSQLFEQLSAADFAVFWPTVRRYWPWGDEEAQQTDAQGRWRRAVFSPTTGRVRLLSVSENWNGRDIPGYLYDPFGAGWRDRHGRTQQSAGTSVPCQCPFCGESYARRQLKSRTSPLRNFRAGFGKTTQLLASELMSRLREGSDERDLDRVKLVSFADSRQDAATAALDLESRHHEDVRREFFVEAIETSLATRVDSTLARRQLGELQKDLTDALDADDWTRWDSINSQITELSGKIRVANEDSIRLSEVLDVQSDASRGRRLKAATAGLVRAGVHPTDPAGIAPIASSGGTRRFAWQELFSKSGDAVCWADHFQFGDDLEEAQLQVRTSLRRLAMATIFHRSYFSLEESGFAYACFPLKGLQRSELAEHDALLRVLADHYRYVPNEWDEIHKPWSHWDDTPVNSRFRKFASAVWGSQNAHTQADGFFNALAAAGHPQGTIQAQNLRLKLVGPDDPYWRCLNCGRVHLHQGGRVCTRCFAPLSTSGQGTAAELRVCNYLGRRVNDPSPTYRLRCEELTAMTSNPSARLRRFKGIFIDDRDDILPPATTIEDVDVDIDRAARTVDVLSVTTTMEVGVDIGSLRAVFQANMPPQRFNYQQRVGRAGRRGQAFSTVLTVCRSKSHDLHYFQHPEQITGDPPHLRF